MSAPAHVPRTATTRAGELADLLRADLATNGFLPGDRITESALAADYGTSRTPVREALRILTQEVLLEYIPNWGYRVAQLEVRELDDLYAVRLGLEAQSVRRLAHGDGDLGAVRDLLELWRSPPSTLETDVNLVFDDEHYHETLAAACGGAVLIDTLRTINRRLHGLRMREFVDRDRIRRTYEQHATILRAILDADTTFAVAAMTAHILEGQRYVRRSALDAGLLTVNQRAEVPPSETPEQPGFAPP